MKNTQLVMEQASVLRPCTHECNSYVDHFKSNQRSQHDGRFVKIWCREHVTNVFSERFRILGLLPLRISAFHSCNVVSLHYRRTDQTHLALSSHKQIGR